MAVGLKFLPSFKIQHNKYSKIMKWTVPRQEKFPALPGFPSQPAQNCSGPVCPAYLVHTAQKLHFFIRYSYIINFFQNGVTTVLDVDCHSMLYLFYEFSTYWIGCQDVQFLWFICDIKFLPANRFIWLEKNCFFLLLVMFLYWQRGFSDR